MEVRTPDFRIFGHPPAPTFRADGRKSFLHRVCITTFQRPSSPRAIGRWQFDGPLAGSDSQAWDEDNYTRWVTSGRKACAALSTTAPAQNVFPANAMVMRLMSRGSSPALRAEMLSSFEDGRRLTNACWAPPWVRVVMYTYAWSCKSHVLPNAFVHGFLDLVVCLHN